MQNWLMFHERCRFPQNMCMFLLHHEYNASRIMRLFLREVLCNFQGAVIAGGFAASRFSQYQYHETWRTNAIDIFVSTKEEVKAIICLYKSKVAKPLSQIFFVTERMFSDTSLEESQIEGEERHSLIGRGTQQQRRESLNINLLHSRILDWIDGYPLASSSEAIFLKDGGLEAEDIHMLHETLANLPDTFGTSNYKIQSTHKMHMPRAKLAAVIPVNVILMKPSCPTAYLENRARYVCSSFDITLCSVALEEISSTLDILRFSYYNDSDLALRDKKLILTRTAFLHCLPMQMKRILKYLRRGYRW